MTSALALVFAAVVAKPLETPAAREQARVCERLVGADSLTACRRALALGLSPERLGPVRQIVARRLVSLERWEELAEHFRVEVDLHPEDGESRRRLGSTLLFALGKPALAAVELAEAVRLAPTSAEARGLLALAHMANGRVKDAAEEMEAARSLDEHLLDHRPAMREAFEAAQRGEAWP